MRSCPGEASSPPFHLMASALNLVADQAAFLEALRAQLGEEKPVVVVIDTLNRSLAGSESDDKDMAAYVRAADAIRDAFDCAVVIVHHCGHNGERPRGHSSLIGAVDAQIAVKRDAAENIVATLELSKDGEAGAEIVSRLMPVEVGRDEDDEPIRSCVIVAVDAPASAKAAKGVKLPKAAQIAFARSKGDRGRRRVAAGFKHIPTGVKARHDGPMARLRLSAGNIGIIRGTRSPNRLPTCARGFDSRKTGRRMGTLGVGSSRRTKMANKRTPFKGGVRVCSHEHFDASAHCSLLFACSPEGSERGIERVAK